VPDPERLAKEYYETKKDKYAVKPEKRSSSHILLSSPPGLDRTEVRAKAQGILDELRAGADWDSMVATHSADKSSAKRNGSLDRMITFGDPTITPPYSEALFKVTELGGYTEITDSQFGIHIIRLDGIEEGGYYPYEEVRAAIYKDIQMELRTLASKEIRARYHLTEDAFIDGAAMEKIFEPYK
jgi:parvulin-like peptidyl-prolyl isomerase